MPPVPRDVFRPLKTPIARLSRVERRTFLDDDQLPWIAELEAACTDIRARAPDCAGRAIGHPDVSAGVAEPSTGTPGKHIPPHLGFYNGVLRYHLDLTVPDDWRSCRTRARG